jgi:signal transduction histidine kinase
VEQSKRTVLARIGRPRRVEVVLALLCAGLGAAEVLVPFASRQGSGSEPLATVGVLCVAAGLLASRRRPLLSLLVVPLIWGPMALIGTFVLFYGQFVPLSMATFMVARFGAGRRPLVGAAVVAGCLLTIDLFVPTMQAPSEIFFHWTVTALVWSAGFGLRTMAQRAHESTHRAIAAEINAAEQAMQAVVDERTRIARELHDIVAHAVSSMVVQAGATEAGADDPGYVRQSLASIRATGNEALGEMRRLVSMLRVSDDVPLTPQPRLEALPALVERTSAEGPRTTLSVTGEPRPLPAGLDLAVFRIVQEALTNVRRHAAARRCEVSLDYGEDCVRVSVVDDGRGTSGNGSSGGHGLVGMRERVGLYGGDLVAGPGAGGGFEVRAMLPVAP